MRKIFSLLLLALAFFLGYLLYKSIEEPIAFKDERDARTLAVSEKLEMIRGAQELFRDITGKYAHNFDTLKQVLQNGELLSVAVIGDPDDPDFQGEITYDTLRIPARDTFPGLGIVLEDIERVPYTGGDFENEAANFDIDAKIIEYQSTDVPVVQVGVKQAKFMGKYADERYQRYDQLYDPNRAIRFGDLSKPTLAGSWQ